MALSKKLAKEISRRINGMNSYGILVDSALKSEDYAKARDAMTWYNREADVLIDMGIEVVKYGSGGQNSTLIGN